MRAMTSVPPARGAGNPCRTSFASMGQRAPRPRRRPPREWTNEEMQLELLQCISDDIHGIKLVIYWIVGIQVVAAILVFVALVAGG